MVGKTDTITVPTTLHTSDANTLLLLQGVAPSGQESPLVSTAWFDGDPDCLTFPSSTDFECNGTNWNL